MRINARDQLVAHVRIEKTVTSNILKTVKVLIGASRYRREIITAWIMGMSLKIPMVLTTTSFATDTGSVITRERLATPSHLCNSRGTKEPNHLDGARVCKTYPEVLKRRKDKLYALGRMPYSLLTQISSEKQFNIV